MQRSPTIQAQALAADPGPLNLNPSPNADAQVPSVDQRIQTYRRDLATISSTLGSLQTNRDRLQDQLQTHLNRPGSSSASNASISELSAQIARLEQNIDQFNESLIRKERLLASLESSYNFLPLALLLLLPLHLFPNLLRLPRPFVPTPLKFYVLCPSSLPMRRLLLLP